MKNNKIKIFRALNRRQLLKGLAGTATGLAVLFNSSSVADGILDYHRLLDIENVEEILQLSQNGIVLHVGQGFDQITIESIKYAVEQAGFNVEIYAGGPPNMITSYAFGHNFPGRHYPAQNSPLLINALTDLAKLHNMALGHLQGP